MKDKLLVFQSDFGLFEGTVSQMHGTAIRVDPTLRIFDLSYLISKFNTWEASYSLYQTCHAWPEETEFVTVIDTGVGSVRKNVVAKTSAGHYRDVYAYTGARLASGVIDFEGVGPGFPVEDIIMHEIIDPVYDGKSVVGILDVEDLTLAWWGLIFPWNTLNE